MIALGNTHSLMLSNQGDVYVSGSSEYGQLGIEMVTSDYSVNFKLFNFGANNPACKVCAGDGYSAVLTQKGEVYTFGKGSFGRLGNGGSVS
mmetsp:Transcript_28166/g.5134  ORF Transcript_28166/g.5134 Transcript_28166/m.5134 type:complete len:91 (-) Transcript_28166:196-468(-)